MVRRLATRTTNYTDTAQEMNALLQDPIFVLFIIIALGMTLGSIKIFGLSLGTSGVLFVALVAGHYQLQIPAGVSSIGLALFVYCVGLGAGGRFFASLARHGSKLAFLAVIVILTAALVTCLCAYGFQIPAGIASGIFAGACTSTPALAAATETLSSTGGASGVSIGYGIAYPFGVAGVVIFVQLIPRLFKFDLDAEARKFKNTSQEPKIVSQLVRVTNKNLVGQPIHDCKMLEGFSCPVTRVARNGRLSPLETKDVFEENQEVLIVGTSDKVAHEVAMIGEAIKNTYLMDSVRERKKAIVTNNTIAGKSLRDLQMLKNYGIIVSRITRLGFTFVPSADTIIDRNDVLTIVGASDKLAKFRELVGHRSNALDETDLLSLGFGLAAGIILGCLQFSLPGGNSVSLGIAGGPLIMALILGHFGKMGPVVGYIPRPTRLLLQDLGLVFFLAGAGVAGGADLAKTVMEYGPTVFLMGALITIAPLIIGYFFAMKVFHLNILECLGGICGGMTSTPALGAITSKTDSQAPVVSYATAYPIALILMTIFAKVVIEVIHSFLSTPL